MKPMDTALSSEWLLFTLQDPEIRIQEPPLTSVRPPSVVIKNVLIQFINLATGPPKEISAAVA